MFTTQPRKSLAAPAVMATAGPNSMPAMALVKKPKPMRSWGVSCSRMFSASSVMFSAMSSATTASVRG